MAPALADEGPLATASEREQRLRQAIQKHCSAVDGLRDWEHGSANRLVLQQFGKSRETMTMQELTEVWAWLQGTHPRRWPVASSAPWGALNRPQNGIGIRWAYCICLCLLLGMDLGLEGSVVALDEIHE